MGRTLLDGLDVVLGPKQPRPAVLHAHVEAPGEPCHAGFVEAELVGPNDGLASWPSSAGSYNERR